MDTLVFPFSIPYNLQLKQLFHFLDLPSLWNPPFGFIKFKNKV